MNSNDIIALREAEWDDRATLGAGQVTAYFNSVNRMAEGLGALEDFWQ